MLGVCILLAVVLYLIDKNRKWLELWKFAKALVIVALMGTILLAGYSRWRAPVATNTPDACGLKLPPGAVLESR